MAGASKKKKSVAKKSSQGSGGRKAMGVMLGVAIAGGLAWFSFDSIGQEETGGNFSEVFSKKKADPLRLVALRAARAAHAEIEKCYFMSLKKEPYVEGLVLVRYIAEWRDTKGRLRNFEVPPLRDARKLKKLSKKQRAKMTEKQLEIRKRKEQEANRNMRKFLIDPQGKPPKLFASCLKAIGSREDVKFVAPPKTRGTEIWEMPFFFGEPK